MIELRLDYLSELELAHAGQTLWDLLTSRPCPIILTLRPAEYGGVRAISLEDRILARVQLGALTSIGKPDFWDFEADLASFVQDLGKDVEGSGICDWTRTICSYHDFAGASSNLDQIYESMAATESRVLKIAIHADDATDCLPVFKLLDRARTKGRDMIAIAMGEAGIATRILGPSRGAFLTYASLDNESATAEGQLTANELREVYRIDQIDQQTEIMGLIGEPVSHSSSPQIQNAALAAAGVNAVYIPFEVRDAESFMRRMVHPRSREIDWKLRGLSVTAPHKMTVMQHLDWIEPAAKEIGAVNTILAEDNELHGYNTDAEAFIQPLRLKFGSLRDARVAVVGAGGAARSAISALKQEQASVSLFARDRTKAKLLADKFEVDCHSLPQASFNGFDVIVNATPSGTHGDAENGSIAVSQQLRGVRLVYDLVYNPIETRLLREAQAAGCEVLGGLEMLIAQAAGQFKLWTGRDADAGLMKEVALKTLKEKGASGGPGQAEGDMSRASSFAADSDF